MENNILEKVKYNHHGLVPAIAQDVESGRVLMMAWMNEESLKLTLETRRAHYFSRSRKKLWLKGETSGHFQDVVDMALDCDGDTILMRVHQIGAACHNGTFSCFEQPMLESEEEIGGDSRVLQELYGVIADRQKNPKEGSYTNFLFEKGIDKICKKVGEEAAETIIAAKNRSKDEVTYEVSDLMYHLMVLLVEQGVSLQDIYRELADRR